MSHKIEQTGQGASFATARVPAWHRLGTVTDEPMTAESALSLANLAGWAVRTEPVGASAVTGSCVECSRRTGECHKIKCSVLAMSYMDGSDRTDKIVYPDDTATVVGVPGWYATVRTHPETGQPDPLGCVGSDYTPVQNEQLAEWLKALVDVSGGVFETAGSLRGGHDVFMTLKLPEGIKVGGVDPIDLYVAGLNNHSGRSPLQALVTPVRVVCANTERAALKNHESCYRIRHTVGATHRMMEAREALKITFEYAGEFQVEADSMINAQMTNDQFESMIKSVWPDKFTGESSAWRQPTQTHFESLQGLFRQADTQEDIRHTVWAGYQSVVEYLDWQVPVIGEQSATPDLARAGRTVSGTYDADKNRAFTLCKALV